jgi:dTDP-glucose pyrophosphorylase
MVFKKKQYFELSDNFLIKYNDTIRLAIKKLNRSAAKILIVTNKKNFFLGTITDGDIRRGLLKSFELEAEIKNIVNKNSIFTSNVIDAEYANLIMVKKKIDHLPLIIKKKPKGIYFRQYFLRKRKENYMPKVFIMAGGEGKRLNPFTLKLPKPMILIDKKPMLYHILKSFFLQGFSQFYISVHFMKKHIIDYFGDGNFLGIKIKYIEEMKPLGTAGSLRYLKLGQRENILVSNCDIISNINYSSILDFHKKQSADATIAVKSSVFQSQFGVIENTGIKVNSIKEKPKIIQYINTGIYIFKGSALNKIKKNSYLNMNNFINELIYNNKKVILYPLYENWDDLGTHQSLSKFRNKYNNKYKKIRTNEK